MKEVDVKNTLLRIYLLSRFVIRSSKKLDKEKTLIFTLLALIEEKPRTIRELANLFTVNHSFMSTFICKIERMGLIQKKIYKDQRFRQIVLAAKGKELRKAISGEGYKVAKILFKNMTEEEILKFGDLVSKINLDYKKLISNIGPDYKMLNK